MNIEGFTIIYKPNKIQLNQIYKWLKEELEIGNKFFYNFSVIKTQLDKGHGVCLLNEKQEVIGFMTFVLHNLYAEIQIANIKHDYIGNGLGKKMLFFVEKYLVDMDKLVLQLNCSPISSKPIWIKMGFLEFVDDEILSIHGTEHLYKIISDNHPYCSRKTDYNSYINLNDKTWNISSLNLNKPIIHPVGANTIINCIVNKEVKYTGVVKKFRNYYFGNYLIIKKINQ